MAVGPSVRRSTRIWIGGILALISITVFIGVHRWMSSRTFVAVDMPVSLARGRSKAGPFEINLRNYYAIRIDTGWKSYFDPNCPSYDRVKARWMLYKDGNAVVKWVDSSDPYAYLGGFDAEDGIYELDLEILSDTACLNPGHPRLLIYTDRDEYDDQATPILWASAFGVALGASLVVLGLIAFSVEFYPRDTRISDSETVGQCFQWAQKLPLRKEFSSPPAFALLATPCLVIVIISFYGDVATLPVEGAVRSAAEIRPVRWSRQSADPTSRCSSGGRRSWNGA
jgi:hypothetical protein